MAVYVWYDLMGPGGMPRELVSRLHSEVARALANPSLKERFVAQGSEVAGGSPGQFSNLIRTELSRWQDVIKASGVTPL